jgi:hypothetical protein
MVGGAVQYKVIIRIDIDEAKDRLDNMLDRMNDFSPILRHAGEKLERVYSENFTTMGAMSAKAMLRGAWPPLDPQYAAWKAMRLPCPPIPLHPGKIQEIKKKYYRRLIHLRIAVVTTS